MMANGVRGADLSRGWLPVAAVAAIIGVAVSLTWGAATVSARLDALADRLDPLTELPVKVGDNAKDVETLKDEVRKLERDLAVANSRIHHLSVEVGIQKKMEEHDAQR